MTTATTINNIGQPFVQLPSVESTNTHLMQLLQKGQAGHGHAVFAHHQTAGKGQRGKAWLTEPDHNIALSVALDVSFLALNQQFMLSAAVALAVHSFFCQYAGEETTIKWPNDIYWQNRKAGGILVENNIRGNDWKWAVVGIGLNINQPSFPERLKNPVSLKQITGKHFDVVELAKELCTFLEKNYQLLKTKKAANFFADYNQHLFKRGEEVKLKKGNTVFSCTIDSVNSYGELLVKGGLYDSFNFGEVEWVL